MERTDYLAYVQQRMPNKRYVHTLGVEETAKKLAAHYGENVAHAETAAILHDVAKYADVAWMEQIVRDYGLDARLIGWGSELLHGPVGAWVAEHELDVTHEDVLNAMRYHTTGRANMSNLEKIIYVADMLEPNRQFPGVDDLRQMMYDGLNEVFEACVKHTLIHLISSGIAVFPQSIECYNDIMSSERN